MALCLLLLLVATSGQTAAPAITVAARALQPGEVVLATITTGTPADSVRAQAFGRTFLPTRIDDGHWQVIVGIDLDVKPGRHTVQVDIGPPGRSRRVEQVLIVKAKTFVTRRLTVDDAFVNPPVAVQDRIASEAHELEQLWASSSATRQWNGPWVRPVPQPANSAFGTRSVFNGQARSPHGGADFVSPAGTPIHAPSAGRVLLARDLYYTGNSVVIDHGAGLVSLFAHLSRIDVAPGDILTTGQVLGLVGATGRVTGPHLHWSARAGGARVDPLALLAILGH